MKSRGIGLQLLQRMQATKESMERGHSLLNVKVGPTPICLQVHRLLSSSFIALLIWTHRHLFGSGVNIPGCGCSDGVLANVDAVDLPLTERCGLRYCGTVDAYATG